MPANDLAARFAALVDVRGPEECWLWQGATRGGYGVIRPGGSAEPIYAHRLALELVDVDVAGLDVHHICEVRRCCNPAHLQPLTASAHSCQHQPRRSVDNDLTPLAPLSPAARQQRDRLYAQAAENIKKLVAERPSWPF